MEINFNGKRALVTGAGKGIGRNIAKALVKYGAEVIALTRTQADLDTLVKEVPSIKPLCVDLGNIEETMKAIEAQDDIHLVVNNAAVPSQDAFLDIKPEDFDRVMSINLKAALFVSQAVARKMVAGGYGGAIVNISSLGSTRAFPTMGTCCCAKAGLDLLTKVMALELGPHKIRVNSINPATVAKMGTQDAPSFKEMAKAILPSIPLRKFADEKDFIDGIVYLLSDKAAMVTGVHLIVDGGLHVH